MTSLLSNSLIRLMTILKFIDSVLTPITCLWGIMWIVAIILLKPWRYVHNSSSHLLFIALLNWLVLDRLYVIPLFAYIY
jgi:hypothetical protein